MIAQTLQDELIEELNNILQGFRLKNRDGTLHEIGIYPQHLPVLAARNDESGEEEKAFVFQEFSDDMTDAFFPFVVVHVQDGSIQSDIMAHTVKVGLAIGIYDDNDDKQGYRDVLQIISKIEERFEKKNLLANKFIAQFPMEWSLQEPDDDTWPYFYGALVLNFDTPTYRRECKSS